MFNFLTFTSIFSTGHNKHSFYLDSYKTFSLLSPVRILDRIQVIRLSNEVLFSKKVNKAAGEVVGASQSGAEEADVQIDFTKMSYTQAKKIEMDTQVRTFESSILIIRKL